MIYFLFSVLFALLFAQSYTLDRRHKEVMEGLRTLNANFDCRHSAAGVSEKKTLTVDSVEYELWTENGRLTWRKKID